MRALDHDMFVFPGNPRILRVAPRLL